MIYKALLTQIGTDKPEAIINKSDLGDNIWFGYDAVGEYSVYSNGLFKENRTHFNLTKNFRAVSGTIADYQVLRVSDSQLKILTFDDTGMFDEMLVKTPFFIEIF